MKVLILIVSIISILTSRAEGTIRPIMSVQLYEQLVEKGATTLSENMTPHSCQYFPQLQSCQLARQNRRRLDYLTYAYLQDVQRFYLYISRENLYQSSVETSSSIRQNRNRHFGSRNPCKAEHAVELVHFYGEDVLEKEIVELLQNPANGQFQKFFTHLCNRKNIGGMACKPEKVEYRAAVFTNINQVEVRRISLPTTCAIKIPV